MKQDIVVTGERTKRELESPKATATAARHAADRHRHLRPEIREQNLLTLRDALATVPGHHLRRRRRRRRLWRCINLRGYSASNDITQDGVRDSAQYSRTDPFNLQQIEVYNGANSVFNGSGSVGGTINLVSKMPQADDLTILSAAVGTDDYYRATRRHQPAGQRPHRGPAERHVPPQRRARPRRREISSAGASRRRSPSASAARPA